MKQYIYVLYRHERQQHYHIDRYIDKWSDVVLYFNSSFVDHKIIWKQLFARFRWYETVESEVFKYIKQSELEYSSVIYFNAITIHIARLFAFIVKRHWYKIAKIEIIK